MQYPWRDWVDVCGEAEGAGLHVLHQHGRGLDGAAHPLPVLRRHPEHLRHFHDYDDDATTICIVLKVTFYFIHKKNKIRNLNYQHCWQHAAWYMRYKVYHIQSILPCISTPCVDIKTQCPRVLTLFNLKSVENKLVAPFLDTFSVFWISNTREHRL